MNGYEVMAQALKAEGTEFLVAFPAQRLIDVAARAGIRPIICRQERAGVNMADGFSRVSNGRKIGVFTMQQGPGAENAFGGVAQAYADSVPVLVLPGGEPHARRGVPPTFDAVPNYKGVTKWGAVIHRPDDITAMVRRAYAQLKHGRLGPVMLEMPTDVMGAEVSDGATEHTPVPRFTGAASGEDVRDLVAALLKAKEPMICAGAGIFYAEAFDELIEFAELTKIPVMTSHAGKSCFPETHPLSLGVGGISRTLMVHNFLHATDFVLGIGTSFTRNTFTAAMPNNVLLAQVTNCAEDINKDYDVAFGAIGDAKVVLRQMIEEVKRQVGAGGRADSSGVVDRIAQMREEWMGQWEPHLTSSEVPISPYRVLRELQLAVDVDNTIITHDSGYPREQFLPFWQPTKPHGYLGWGKSTQLGYGLGLALGAKLAAPERQVINVMGDAAFGMAGLDLETASRAGIAILTVVLNNGVMTHYHDHMPFATEKWQLNELGGNYAAVAEGLGVFAQRVSAPGELAGAIRKAIAMNQSGKPALIEVMTKEEETVSRFTQGY